MLIEDALFTLLSQDAGVTGIVGDRIYPVRMPQLEKETTTTPAAVSYPALIYTLVERPRTDTHDGPDGLVKSFFLLECIGKRYTAEVKQLANKVRLALNGKANLLASIYGDHVKRIALQDERDTWGYDDVEQLQLYDTEMDFVIHHRDSTL